MRLVSHVAVGGGCLLRVGHGAGGVVARGKQTIRNTFLRMPQLSVEDGEYASLVEMLLTGSFIALSSLCLKTPESVFPILASISLLGLP